MLKKIFSILLVVATILVMIKYAKLTGIMENKFVVYFPRYVQHPDTVSDYLKANTDLAIISARPHLASDGFVTGYTITFKKYEF